MRYTFNRTFAKTEGTLVGNTDVVVGQKDAEVAITFCKFSLSCISTALAYIESIPRKLRLSNPVITYQCMPVGTNWDAKRFHDIPGHTNCVRFQYYFS